MGKRDQRTVGDYVSLQRGNTYSGKLVGEPGPALLGLGSIEPGGGFRPDKYKTFGGECPAKLMLLPGDVYVALKGATKDGSMVGSVARLPEYIPAGRLTQDTARLDFFDQNPEIVNHLYWILRTPQYRQYCDGRVTGSASASFSRDDFLSYPVPPITSISKALVHLFEALETKIDLNRRMNETLEAIAQALFRSWFVDFDPVRAKQEGRQPPGLDAATAALFPDSFEDSSLGPIPAGWGVRPLGDCVELKRGYDLPSQQRQQGTVPVVSSSGPSGRHSTAMARGPGVVTGRYGTIGQVFFIEDDFWPLNTTLYVRDFKGHAARFIAALLDLIDFSSYSDKAAVPGVNRNHLHMEPVVVPARGVEQRFVDLVDPLWQRHALNRRECNTLSALRDALLPKLLSRDIRVGDLATSVQ